MIKRIMITAIVVYLALLAVLFFFQRNLQYVPSGKIEETSNYHLDGFVEQNLTTKDNLKIFSWYKKPHKNHKIILYFHGNAGNLGDRSSKFFTFADDGFGILAISYRGYSKSEGNPSEAGLLLDAEAALNFLFNKGYKAQDIILFGESLGSGVAVQLATRFDFAAVILESPYSSIVNIAKKSYPSVPVSLLLKDKFVSIKYAPRISSPVLILHGTADNVVPFQEGKLLFNVIKSKKKFITIEGAGHLNFGDEFLLKEVKIFLEDI